jgi:hypothetical protein
MMLVEVRSHLPDEEGVLRPARLNIQRWWCFCGPRCRDAWYETATDEGLVPEHLRAPADRYLQAGAVHVNPDQTRSVHDVARHETYDDLDVYWRSPGPAGT